MATITTYGPGGYDPSKPNNNVMSVGDVVSVEDIPEVPAIEARITQLEDDQTALRGQVRAVGVGLAVAAGVAPEDAVAMIDAALT